MATPVGNDVYLAGRTDVRDPTLQNANITAQLDFTGAEEYSFEFAAVNNTQQFGTPLTIFVDNGTGPNPITVNCSITNQSFTVPPFAQGNFALNATPVSVVTVSGDGGNTTPVTVSIYNYVITPNVWYAPGQNNPVAANSVQGAMTEGSDVAASASNDPLYIGGIDRGTGLFHGIAVDATGNLQVEFASAQTVAATIANGADATQGAQADAAWNGVPGAASVVSILKALWNAITARQGAYTDRSITNLSGASEQLMAANANRRVLVINNPNAANPIAVNLTGGAAALNTGGSLTIAAGQTVTIEDFPSTSIINVIGTAGDDVTAYEG